MFQALGSLSHCVFIITVVMINQIGSLKELTFQWVRRIFAIVRRK